MDSKIYTAYEDGLIIAWVLGVGAQKAEGQIGQLLYPLLGHTNRINSMMATETNSLITTSNDCTVRQWDGATGLCQAVFKFGDPISCVVNSSELKLMFVACWDRQIRCIDTEQ